MIFFIFHIFPYYNIIMYEIYIRLCMIDKSCNTWDGRLTQELLPFCLQTLVPQDVFIRELTHPEISKSFSCIEMNYFHVLKYSNNLLTCIWVLLAPSARCTAPQESVGGRRWTPGMWGPRPRPPAPPGRPDDGRAVRLNEVVLLSAGGLQLVPAHADVSVWICYGAQCIMKWT